MPDLSDPWVAIRELQAEVRRLRSPIALENSSITNGRMRFIGGLLRVDSGGRVEIEGTLEGGGTFIWTGTLTNNGPLIQNGVWELNGDGEIAGDVGLTGDFKVAVGGEISVAGTLPIRIRVVSGQARMDVGGGHVVGIAGGVQMGVTGGGGVAATSGAVAMILGAASVSVTADGVGMSPMPGSPPSGVTAKYLLLGDDGIFYAGSAGGGGGEPGDPPAGNPNGYIWPADPAVYGISDNFAAHIARGSAEPGVDVMTPVGSPLWSPANGTIVAVQTSPSGATGRYITLVTTEGDWFRFLHNSAIAVTTGQTVTQTQLLGYTGGSGFGSEAYYGPHTHISFSAGYTGMFPGASNMDDFEAHMAAA